jgi:hypothetical protein
MRDTVSMVRPFAGALAAQHHHMVLKTFHLPGGGFQDGAVERRVTGEGAHGVAPDHDHFAVGQGLGGEAVVGAGLKAEDVAGVVEVADLAATVHVDPGGPHHATNQAVEHLHLVVLGVDLGLMGVGHVRAETLKGRGQGACCGGAISGARGIGLGHLRAPFR